ncbi:PP2C family protein-serine/threonine phosphatase [Agromyces silvae]|uniref:PP2C family protein-serine/threonine phosphatase n=1 Tax=Agromyces silvae TaxID=3388266 RepID=UPI00280AD946|nr:SpoIIE family protein phosphatase [Agromyces protaetiae]
MVDGGTVVLFDDDARQRAVEELGILDTPREERFDRVARLAHELFEVPMVSVTFLDGDRQFRKAEIGLGGREAAREQSFCDATVRGSGTLVVEDAATDPRFAENPFVVGEPNLRFYAGHPLQAPGGEQVGTLCIVDTAPRTMDSHERELLRDLAGWLQSELSRDDELDRASVVQRGLLPRTTPEMPGYEMAAISLAAGRVGGDFYDWYEVPGGMRFTVADVMGKGVGAAITAASVRAALHTSADRELVHAVERTTALLDQDLTEATTFVTLFHAELEARTGRMRFVDAGHNLVGVLRADGEWAALHSDGLPLGMSFGDRKAAGEIVLDPGDAVLCCSDGLLDLLGDHPLQQMLEVARTSRPDDCVATVRRIADGRSLPDDVTAVVIRRLPDARTEHA